MQNVFFFLKSLKALLFFHIYLKLHFYYVYRIFGKIEKQFLKIEINNEQYCFQKQKKDVSSNKLKGIRLC